MTADTAVGQAKHPTVCSMQTAAGAMALVTAIHSLWQAASAPSAQVDTHADSRAKASRLGAHRRRGSEQFVPVEVMSSMA
jgi:hypothetical protein